MNISRRALLTAAVASMAGCSSRLNSKAPEPIRTPTQSESTNDILISNDTSGSVETTIEFVPDGENESALDLTVALDRGEDLVWAENTLLDEAGRITAASTGDAIERQTGEAKWPNDSGNIHTVYVATDDDGIDVQVWVV